MIETFGDIKELIDEAMNNFRRNNLLVIRGGTDGALEDTWRALQISVSGTDVWRRVMVPEDCALEDLHPLIQTGLDWKNSYRHRFFCEGPGGTERKPLDDKTRIRELCGQGITELDYEYGTNWNVKIIILSPYRPGKDEAVRYVAGEGASPPEIIGGPLRFRKILSALKSGSDMEKQAALHELGPDFVPGLFDMERCNRNLNL
jgi:hypothetical protein